jgi:hypothetical protein
MFGIAFWRKLVYTIIRRNTRNTFMIWPTPSAAKLGQFHLVNYEIPLTENLGDC